jgi:hypothetical protein
LCSLDRNKKIKKQNKNNAANPKYASKKTINARKAISLLGSLASPRYCPSKSTELPPES